MELVNTEPCGAYKATLIPITLVDLDLYDPEYDENAEAGYSEPEKPFFEVEKNGWRRSVIFTKAIRKQFSTPVGLWFVLRMDELLTTEQAFSPHDYDAVMKFISVFGEQAEALFWEKYVPHANRCDLMLTNVEYCH
jgi:hypothetical protein